MIMNLSSNPLLTMNKSKKRARKRKLYNLGWKNFFQKYHSAESIDERIVVLETSYLWNRPDNAPLIPNTDDILF